MSNELEFKNRTFWLSMSISAKVQYCSSTVWGAIHSVFELVMSEFVKYRIYLLCVTSDKIYTLNGKANFLFDLWAVASLRLPSGSSNFFK